MPGGSASPSAGCGPAPFQHLTVRAPDGLHLAVRLGGEGPPLLLVHGFTGSSQAWGDELLAALAARFRVVAPDLVGHGDSARPHDPARYRLERVLDDLATVQHTLVGGAAAWVGYSMGGRVALAAAVHGVAPMTRLVLESASPGLADAPARAQRADDDEERARQLDAGDLAGFVDAWMAQPLFHTQRALPTDVRERERARRLAQDPRALAACLRGLGTGVQPPMWDGLERVQVPTLLITGAADGKFEALAAAMVRRMPRARHHSVAEVGHAVHLEDRETWLRIVGGFVENPADPDRY